ncbi:thiamine pyrophosphate-dependent enzyme [Candidatus Latescibacterota bacterium]
MILIRRVEECIGDLVIAGAVRCPCHLAIGQEAIAVGVSSQLRASDRVFGGHRSHSHFLALNGDLTALIAEVLGRVSGCSGGMGGSQHLVDTAAGFGGSVPIVAATVPVAAGAALAAKKDGRGDVAVAYFGDGAVEEGSVHETMNLASLMRLPLVLICENNLFASHMHIAQRQPLPTTCRFAEANGIPWHLVDGNDVIAVEEAAVQAVRLARSGGGGRHSSKLLRTGGAGTSALEKTWMWV